MDLEFAEGFLDYHYLKSASKPIKEKNSNNGWSKVFLIRCILYGFSSGSGAMMSQSISTLNVPLMSLFNKTSVEVLGIHDGGSLLLSFGTWMAMSGMIFSISILIPLIDYFGRKFICVYLKFVFSLIGISLMIVGWSYQNAFFYLPGLSCCVISTAIIGLADPLYISEISPKEHKGLYTASVLAFAGVCNGICLLLAREDIWGTPEKWGYIAILAQCVNLFIPISGYFLPEKLPDSDVDNIVEFYKSHFGKFSTFWKQEKHEKNKLILLISMQIFLMANICLTETSFSLPIYREEGLDTNQALTMILSVFIIALPTIWFGPMFIHKMERKPLLLIFLSILILKALLHVINAEAQFWILSYLNVLCYRMIEGSGFPALTYVIATEILPQEFVVTGGQLAMLGSSIFIGVIAAVTPFAVGRFLQLYFLLITGFSIILALLVLKLLGKIGNNRSEKTRLISGDDEPPPAYSSI